MPESPRVAALPAYLAGFPPKCDLPPVQPGHHDLQSQITKISEASGTACWEAAEQGYPILGDPDSSQQLYDVTLAIVLGGLFQFPQPPSLESYESRVDLMASVACVQIPFGFQVLASSAGP